MQVDKKEKDINDVFSDIFLSEENVIEEAYEEGFSLGLVQGNPEGYHLGYHRGAELGAEIGYYTGITETFLTHYENSQTRPEKIINSLKCLKSLLDNYPRLNEDHIDLGESINIIRAKFKKICSQLKVNVHYSEKDTLSF
ncbi:uncharacterized protein [Leptinotarsa decemlineata]|uniref:uncharacterized protein n=1 Tax=Leptinotarsa decemlineata TaxID=7539 RepID=UPI003D3059F3